MPNLPRQRTPELLHDDRLLLGWECFFSTSGFLEEQRFEFHAQTAADF
jgi:hypothetical protein